MKDPKQRLRARQGAEGYEFYLASDSAKFWATIAEEFGINPAEAKLPYPLEENYVCVCD